MGIVLIASHNQHKIKEVSRILIPLGYEVKTDRDLGITLDEVEETGETFMENAKLKAGGGCKQTGYPCIADDSGLCVDALGGEPGVYSARYSGKGDDGNNALLLSKLEGVPCEKRTARFVSAICLTFPDGNEITAEGVCEGSIGFEKRGDKGFGYDPLFMVGDRSFAEMSDTEKDAISHRGNALKAFSEKFKREFITGAEAPND